MNAIVENHAVADVDTLFHDVEEESASTHAHKVGIKGAEAKQNLADTLLEMHSLARGFQRPEGEIAMRNAAAHMLLDQQESGPTPQLPVAAQ